MGIVCFTEMRIIAESLIRKIFQALRVLHAVLYDKPCHGSTAGLCPYGLHLQFLPFTYIEQGLNHPNALAHTFPFKQMLKLFCCQMNKNAVICLHTLYQDIRQTGFPKAKHILPLPTWQFNGTFHPIRTNTIQRTQQAIEKRRNP